MICKKLFALITLVFVSASAVAAVGDVVTGAASVPLSPLRSARQNSGRRTRNNRSGMRARNTNTMRRRNSRTASQARMASTRPAMATTSTATA